MFRTSLLAQSCGSVYLLLCFHAEEIIFPLIIFGDHASLFPHSPSLSFVCCRCSRRNQSQTVDRYLYPESRLAMFAVGFRVSLLAIRGRRMLFAPSILPGDLCLCWVSVLQSEEGENIFVFRSRFRRQDFFDTMNAQKLHLQRCHVAHHDTHSFAHTQQEASSAKAPSARGAGRSCRDC